MNKLGVQVDRWCWTKGSGSGSLVRADACLIHLPGSFVHCLNCLQRTQEHPFPPRGEDM